MEPDHRRSSENGVCTQNDKSVTQLTISKWLILVRPREGSLLPPNFIQESSRQHTRIGPPAPGYHLNQSSGTTYYRGTRMMQVWQPWTPGSQGRRNPTYPAPGHPPPGRAGRRAKAQF
jgi:hypothetical protein